METLRLSKEAVFLSLSGEHGLFKQGEPCIFVRLSGCNLTCHYCDADHSYNSTKTIEEIVKEIRTYQCKNVLITGGEPLLQEKGLSVLVNELRKLSCKIQIETNGTLVPTKNLFTDADMWVVDIKSKSQIERIFSDWTAFSVNTLITRNILFKAVLRPGDIFEFLMECQKHFTPLFKKAPGLENRIKLSISPIMPSGSEMQDEQVHEILFDVLELFSTTLLDLLHKGALDCELARNISMNMQLHKFIGCA